MNLFVQQIERNLGFIFRKLHCFVTVIFVS
jgi:hypothetical protein